MKKYKRNQLDSEKLFAIEEQIRNESVPYIYDTKEYPVEVIIAKHEKQQFLCHIIKEILFGNLQKNQDL